jgi:hypothetical protein
MDAHDLIMVSVPVNRVALIKVWEVFSTYGVDIQDPLESAIILDIIRSSPTTTEDTKLFTTKGWITEAKLIDTRKEAQCNFRCFFDLSVPPNVHPLLPSNEKSRFLIYRTFLAYKEQLSSSPPIYYPRYKHKNMSRSTRRDFEERFDTSLEDFPIFGQDDWIRVYHENGVFLEGSMEERSKWYPSGAKPRTYFAQGGTAYRYSRFLQDFFTELVDVFPSTNHVTRLRPERLHLVEEDEHFLIYDLSSFTSNMTEQRSFMSCLAWFFSGVQCYIVDEVLGPTIRDLGEMLLEYNEHCVDKPLVSQERAPPDCRTSDDILEHLAASMLGIFGNLMTCTLAHFLILSPLVDTFDRINVAGDDGLVPLLTGSELMTSNAISLVGDCAPDKTFVSNEQGAVHLKRPMFELHPRVHLGYNFVPPNVATCAAYLLGSDCDPRYSHIGIEDMTLSERISVVGKDLMRFLRSVYDRRQISDVSISDLLVVYRGFEGLVHSILGFRPVSRQWTPGRLNYVWPLSPADYDFFGDNADPLAVYCLSTCSESLMIPVYREEPVDYTQLQYVGDFCECNSSKGLRLLETLGYLEKDPVEEEVRGMEAVYHLFAKLSGSITMPSLYRFTVSKPIPFELMT